MFRKNPIIEIICTHNESCNQSSFLKLLKNCHEIEFTLSFTKHDFLKYTLMRISNGQGTPLWSYLTYASSDGKQKYVTHPLQKKLWICIIFMYIIRLHYQRFTNKKPSVFDVSLWARLNLRRLSNNFGISSNGWSFSKKLSPESIESHHPVNAGQSVVT